MAKMVGKTVFRFFNGKTVETFEKDEDIQTGTVTTVVGKKARIAWDGMYEANGKQSHIYVDMARLVQIDTTSYELVETTIPDTPAALVETDTPTQTGTGWA